MADQICKDISRFSESEIYLFKEGTLFRAYDHLGAHVMSRDGVKGVYFAVWAPNAERVSVVGDFNGWDSNRHVLTPRWDSSGIWEGFIPAVRPGALYKFYIISKGNHQHFQKKDPYAFGSENPPATASVVADLSYAWQDEAWMQSRQAKNSLQAPMSIYELHLGSWMRNVEENRWLT
ncbi:MAG TPA: 1,4-alpha-glucan branching enzyme, partial [Candidatus Bathyarchaeia archaeon]|nr:1,4-alpha-glucan branching enzyme [Candidatus Bathyarchaeia archaeon]